MKVLNTTAISLLMLMCMSCNFVGKRVRGNGNTATETRNIGKASRIDIIGSMDVELTEGPPSAKVQADDNLMEYILVEENDGWIKIRAREGYNLDSKSGIKVFLSSPFVEEIRISGSGNLVSSAKFVSQDKMMFKTAGSGDVTMTINCPEVSASIAGSGNIDLSGETRDISVSIAGSGNFNGEDLKSENADVTIAGSGDVLIYADVKLSAKITGSGEVKYKGNASVDKKIIGNGSVTKTN